MRRYEYLVRPLILSVVCNLLLGCITIATTPLPPRPKPIPTPVEERLDIKDLVIGGAPNYRGITLGHSNKDDVIAKLGKPNVVKTLGDYESLHYFGDGRQEFFLIKSNIVQSVTSDHPQFWLTQDGHDVSVSELEQTLGSSFVVTPSFGFSTRVFTSYGVAVADHFVPYPYQFFVPISPEEYQKLWHDLPLGYDPFPLIPSIEDVGIKPGYTTREQVARLLGQPDKINYENQGEPWWYFIEPDMLGRLLIDFNADSTVKSMSIKPDYEVPKSLRLEEAVKQYGKPDLLELLPGFEGDKYATMALVYLNRGLRLDTPCVSPKCDIVRPDTQVGRKFYFQPMALAEYQTLFSVKGTAYIEWHGFDQ